MAKYLDSTGLATVWEKVKALIPTSLKNPYALTIQANGTTAATYDGSAAKTVNITAMTAATASAAGKAGLVPAPAAGKQTSFLRGDGTWVVPTNTTYTAATTTSAGLMSAADKVSMNKLGGSVYYDRTSVSGVSRLGLFSVTPVAVTVSGLSLTVPPVVEFETVITSTSSTSSFCTLRGTLCCNSDNPTLIWSANAKSTWFGDNLIKGITYDKTNKQVFLEVNSSSSYVQNLAMRTYIYRADHCTTAQITATTSSTNIKTFTI